MNTLEEVNQRKEEIEGELKDLERKLESVTKDYEKVKTLVQVHATGEGRKLEIF